MSGRSTVSFDDETTLAIKMPAFWRYLDLLPETRFIVCLRDPLEVISSYERVGGRLAEGLDYDIPFNRAMNEALIDSTDDGLLSSRRHVRLRRASDSSLISAAPNVHVVRYENWSADPEGQLSGVECLSRCRTRAVACRHPGERDADRRSSHGGDRCRALPYGQGARVRPQPVVRSAGRHSSEFGRRGAGPVKAAKDLAVSVLGTRPVSAAVERVLRGRLRVVAYHGVPDAEAFRRQLDLVVSRYNSVCGADVVAAMNGGPPLPERAVWITFDDGHSSVVEHALPLLRERGMSATLFVCPGLVDAGEPPWWEVIESAVDHGWTADRLPTGRYVQALKALPDAERRQYVADADAFSKRSAEGGARPVPVAGTAELECLDERRNGTG